MLDSKHCISFLQADNIILMESLILQILYSITSTPKAT